MNNQPTPESPLSDAHLTILTERIDAAISNGAETVSVTVQALGSLIAEVERSRQRDTLTYGLTSSMLNDAVGEIRSQLGEAWMDARSKNNPVTLRWILGTAVKILTDLEAAQPHQGGEEGK